MDPEMMTVSLLSEDRLRQVLDALLADRLAVLETRLDQLAADARNRPLEARGPVLLCERELAALLGVHPRTIRRLECNQEIPESVQIGGSKRWPLRDIEEWLAGLRGTGQP